MNVNSLFSKIDEIRDIANRIKPAVLGITESKLDSSVTNMEVNINGYSIIRNDRNRHGGGVACYVKNDLCFNTKKIFPNSVEHVFFEILIPKVKPIAVGIFYRPPNSNDFLNLLSNSFQQIDLNKKEIDLLGDFNINLFQNGKFLLKENQPNQVKDPTSSLISKSIKYSTFPNDCKIAKLKPLFKRGSKTDPKNYHPISLLPLISKIIEKIIHDQTQNFLDKNNVIYRYQSGFRTFHSTDSCLSYLNNKIATGFESGLFTGMILIDLQKAFDTINHDILIKK